MPFVEHRGQYECRNCGRATLHTMRTKQASHLVHGVITVLFFGLWLPVWIIATILAQSFKEPWRCMSCGQVLGDRSPAGEAMRHAGSDRIRAQQERDRAAREAARRREIAASARSVGLGVNRLATFIGGLPSRYNRLLWTVAGGQENGIVYGFLWVLTAAGALAAAVAGVLAIAA